MKYNYHCPVCDTECPYFNTQDYGMCAMYEMKGYSPYGECEFYEDCE